MIEKTLIQYLTASSLAVPVFAERPTEDIPESYIVIDKTGTRRTNHITTTTMAIQSYAPSMLAAAELNERLIEVMDGMVEMDEISAVRLNTDYNFCDTASKIYRYQAVYDITHY